jgi:hypothetical protein
MENLRIDNPCPVLLSRMSKTDSGFSCKSCKKEVIDFRDKTPEEINRSMGKDACGVFHTSQLSQQPERSFFRKGIFALLTVFSFLGFNVSPVNAAPIQQRSSRLEISPSAEFWKARKENQDRPKKKKRKNKKKEALTKGYI